MSKIICDICGTSYPETGKQCPICGCVRPGDVQRVINEVKSDGNVSTGYTYVKGGRFSKNNVKKRSQADTHAEGKSKTSAPKPVKEENEKPNRGMVITAIVLLLAIIGVVIFIAVRFFAPYSGTNDPNASTSDVACIDLRLDFAKKELTVGETALLTATKIPAGATEAITYSSADESIATVSDKGLITAVAEGTTDIIVNCGIVSKKCTVECKAVEEPTGMTIPDITGPTETTPAQDEFRLNRNELTLKKGGSWEIYSGSIDKTLITWSSDDENIATVNDGKVVAVGVGSTTIYAEYEGRKLSCPVTCVADENTGVGGNGGVSEDGGVSGNGGVSEDGGVPGNGGVSEDGGVPGNGGVSEDGGNTNSGSYVLYTMYGDKVAFNKDLNCYDITLNVGESVSFYLKDDAGNKVNLEWTSGGEAVSASGGNVKAVSRTNETYIYATNGDTTYRCRIIAN